MKCHRCDGAMAHEKFYGPGDPFSGWRCLLCGEILDPLIWENRSRSIKFKTAGSPRHFQPQFSVSGQSPES
jgi:hypothetical protein